MTHTELFNTIRDQYYNWPREPKTIADAVQMIAVGGKRLADLADEERKAVLEDVQYYYDFLDDDGLCKELCLTAYGDSPAAVFSAL